MDQRGGGKRLWLGNLPSSPSDIVWAADGSGVYYSMEEHGEANEYFMPLGRRQPAASRHERRAHADGVSIAKNGQAAAIRSSAQAARALVTFSIARPADMKTLVDVNADVLAGVTLADAEEIRYTAPDGLKVQGWLIKPANFDPAKKYPLVLWIHGGPWSMYRVGLELGVPELRGQRLRRAVDQPARLARATGRTSSTAFSSVTRARTTTT